MSSFMKLSSWACSVACGVCLALAVLATPRTALADPPVGDPNTLTFLCDTFISSCYQPRCKVDPCLCQGSSVICCDKPGGSDCECTAGCP